MLSAPYGAVAQLVAHLHGMEGVRGSSPLSSTVRISRGRPTEITVLGRFLNQPAAGTAQASSERGIEYVRENPHFWWCCYIE